MSPVIRSRGLRLAGPSAAARFWPGRPGRRQRGVVMVEMAIISPLLVSLVFAAIHFGFVMMERAQYSRAVESVADLAATADFANENELDALEAAFLSMASIDPDAEAQVRLLIRRFVYVEHPNRQPGDPFGTWRRDRLGDVAYGGLPVQASATDGPILEPGCVPPPGSGQDWDDRVRSPSPCMEDVLIEQRYAGQNDGFSPAVDGDMLVVVEAWRADLAERTFSLFDYYGGNSAAAPEQLKLRAVRLHRQAPATVLWLTEDQPYSAINTEQQADDVCRATVPTCPNPATGTSPCVGRQPGGPICEPNSVFAFRAFSDRDLTDLADREAALFPRRPIWYTPDGGSYDTIARDWSTLFGDSLYQSTTTPTRSVTEAWSFSTPAGGFAGDACAIDPVAGVASVADLSDAASPPWLSDLGPCAASRPLICVCSPPVGDPAPP